MKNRKLWCTVVIGVLVVAAAAAPAAAPARADTLFYDNGWVNGTVNAYAINCGFSVSDSFTAGILTFPSEAWIGL
jgi:hypothetical protein